MLVITTYGADSMLDSSCFVSGNVLRCLVPKIKMPTLLAPFELRAKAIALVRCRVRIRIWACLTSCTLWAIGGSTSCTEQPCSSPSET